MGNCFSKVIKQVNDIQINIYYTKPNDKTLNTDPLQEVIDYLKDDNHLQELIWLKQNR